MRAIVLSGGGSKGSYQIGVWKALKKLHIKYDIVTGTSVGSLNAAFMTQNTYKKAVKLYKHTNMYTLFGEDIKRPKNNRELFKIYSSNLKNGGIYNEERNCYYPTNLFDYKSIAERNKLEKMFKKWGFMSL